MPRINPKVHVLTWLIDTWKSDVPRVIFGRKNSPEVIFEKKLKVGVFFENLSNDELELLKR